MINTGKTTNFNELPQIAGVFPGDNNIEFVGVRKTKQVFWLQNGSARYFSDLPIHYYNLLKEAYLADEKAVEFLQRVSPRLNVQVELYTYYMYGDLDHTPDISNGKLAPSENFRDTQNCPSLHWKSKNLNIGEVELTPRQIIIIDFITLPDKAIAGLLKISLPTLDFHKKKLFDLLGVSCKLDLLKLSIKHKIVA